MCLASYKVINNVEILLYLISITHCVLLAAIIGVGENYSVLKLLLQDKNIARIWYLWLPFPVGVYFLSHQATFINSYSFHEATVSAKVDVFDYGFLVSTFQSLTPIPFSVRITCG